MKCILKSVSAVLVLILIFAQLTAFPSVQRQTVEAASTYSDYTTYTYSDCSFKWTVPNTTPYGTSVTCTAAQGMNVGTNYIYVSKVDSTDTYCDITRINANTGEKTVMKYYSSLTATKQSACDTLGHANDLTVYTVDVSALSEAFNTQADVYGTDGKAVTDGIAATGLTVKLSAAETDVAEYKVFVSGDVSGNGNITVTDYLRIKLHFRGAWELKDEYFAAGDLDGNGTVDSSDYLKLKAYFCGNYKFD